MLLSSDDAGLFFKLHRSLMWFVNERLQTIPNVGTPDEFSCLVAGKSRRRMQTIQLTTGSWLGDRILVADVHGGEVTVVALTEFEDSKEDGEVRAEQIRQARRGRERRGVPGEGQQSV